MELVLVQILQQGFWGCIEIPIPQATPLLQNIIVEQSMMSILHTEKA